MSEYDITKNPDQAASFLKSCYLDRIDRAIGRVTDEDRSTVDAAIEIIRAEAKAEALREAAERTYSRGIAGWLKARADQIEKEAGRGNH